MALALKCPHSSPGVSQYASLLTFLSHAAPTQRQAANKISGNHREEKNLPRIKRNRSAGRNRDVKVNVKPEKDEWPSL